MSKRLILILALAFVVGIAVSAYAAVQNVKVSGDLSVSGVGRHNLEFKDTNEEQKGILSAVRLRVDADLTDNVSTTVRLINERLWAKEGTTGSGGGSATTEDDSDIDLDLAYVTLREFLYSPLTLVVGRQELRYGNALIIADVDTNATATADSNLPSYWRDLSLRKSFDAIKAILNYDPLVVDLVYAKLEENNIALADDVSLMGINASYAVNKNLSTEAYLWSRDREWGSTGVTTGPGQGERLNTVGARTIYTGIENLSLGLEGAYQFGDHYASTTLYPDDARTAGVKAEVSAYALQFVSGYMFPTVKFTPSLAFNYTRLSGDKDRSTRLTYKGWNPMFEDQAGGTIFNRVLGYSNAQLFNLGVGIKPMEDLAVRLDLHHIRLISPFETNGDATRDLSGIGTDADITVVTGQKHLADELDLGVTYDYTEDVQIGLNTGIYVPGPVYDKDGPMNKKTAAQIIGSMKVTF